ncbi:MAG TPA: DUF2007 domain-containing protein [Tepidiformaceae bacterium]|nr:DUF2007 domain-containing protein [Tepidiformaceae bacterium]
MAGRAVEVARAPDALTAELWIDVLAEAGIEARSYAIGISGALGGADVPWGSPHPVLVAEEDADDARAVLHEVGREAAPGEFVARQDREALQRMVIAFVGMGMAAAIVLAVAFAVTG